MDLFGIEPSDDRVIVRVNGSAIGDDEIAIDAEGYREADPKTRTRGRKAPDPMRERGL